jgi:sec-independent protein translocase protein TatC
MMLVFGLAFQMPLVILFLAAAGIVEAASMAKQRRVVILVIVIVAAIISPTTDAISLCLLALPMLGLFEFGLLLARRAERRNRASGVRH